MAQFLEKFSIHLDPNFTQEMYKIHGHYVQYGEIVIDDFKEDFVMSEELWSIQDYLQQWRYAWEYLKNNNQTQFIANIQTSNNLITSWTIYKMNDLALRVQNAFFYQEHAQEIFKKNCLSPANSFFFMIPRIVEDEDGDRVSEWVLPITQHERKILNM